METSFRDVRFAFKMLLKERTFSATVLLTLAVCVGANVAIFSVIHAVLLEPLPFHEPDRLVTVFNSYPGAGVARASNGSVDFFQRRENIAAFQEVALFQASGNTVGEAGATDRVRTLTVTPSLFPLLGVQAALGRTFTEDEMVPGNALKVVLTDAYWREAFGADPGVVGRDMRVDGRTREVVGVLSADFRFPGVEDARFFIPIAFDDAARQLDAWHSNNFSMLARLRPGATVEQARAQNEALNQALVDQWPLPNARQVLQDAGYHTQVHPAKDDLVRDVRPVLFMLWAGVGLVLLIGCVNIANLLLARAQTRVGEVATRLALGAPRSVVARQVLTEAVVLGVVGGGLGVMLGWIGLKALMGLGAADLPRGTEIGIDPTVLGFTLLLSVGAGALFGSIPVIQVMRGDLTQVFRTEGRTRTAGHRAVWARSALVAGQVAVAFVLLIGAGLMLASFRAALLVDPGFEPDGVITAVVSLPSARYGDAGARTRFWDEMLREVEALPGVQAASMTGQLPFTGDASSSVIFPESHVPPPGESLLSPLRYVVGPGYFEAMGIELLEGRDFLASDEATAQQVVIIDEWLADRYWKEGSPIGERMVYSLPPGFDSIPEENLFTVVGVVRTVKHNALTDGPAEHVGAYYFTYPQQTPGTGYVVARAGVDAATLTPALRDVVRRLDAELPVFDARTMAERVDDSLSSRKVPLVLLGVFSAVALFLAVVGIYGALAYSVTQRRREIGIRLAMGSAPAALFRDVVVQGLRMTGVGLAVGAAATWGLGRVVQSLLFGVQATDPRVFGGAILLLGVVGLLACAVPARRATRVDPVTALGG